jgi:hypothetical protein
MALFPRIISADRHAQLASFDPRWRLKLGFHATTIFFSFISIILFAAAIPQWNSNFFHNTYCYLHACPCLAYTSTLSCWSRISISTLASPGGSQPERSPCLQPAERLRERVRTYPVHYWRATDRRRRVWQSGVGVDLCASFSLRVRETRPEGDEATTSSQIDHDHLGHGERLPKEPGSRA